MFCFVYRFKISLQLSSAKVEQCDGQLLGHFYLILLLRYVPDEHQEPGYEIEGRSLPAECCDLTAQRSEGCEFVSTLGLTEKHFSDFTLKTREAKNVLLNYEAAGHNDAIFFSTGPSKKEA